MTATRNTVEIRYRPRGSGRDFQVWLAVAPLEEVPALEIVQAFVERLRQDYTAFEFRSSRPASRLGRDGNKQRRELEMPDGYQVAVEMYKREHERWHQWALFFFGSIVSVFIAADHARGAVPIWVASAIASALSAAWTIAAVSIRITTSSWNQVLQAFEAGDPATERGPFTCFLEFVTYQQSWRSQYRFCFQRAEWFRLTAILVIMGTVSTLLFLVLAVALAVGWISEHPLGGPTST